MDPDPERVRAVDELVFRFLEASRERPATDVLEELCLETPALADELRALVNILNDSGLAEEESPSETLGPYRLLRRIGAGGMGVVYLAEERDRARSVALKVVRPEQLFFDSARERFRREIDATQRLQHRGIAAVYGCGEARGVPYFAQEYVAGASLEQVLRALEDREATRLSGRDMLAALRHAMAAAHERTGSALRVAAPHAGDLGGGGDLFSGAWSTACARIAEQAADALAHAHAHGVLHRDVKPSNLLLTPQGRVVLVDFGLASLADADSLTRTGSVLGSLPFLAPELVDGGQATPASDVYSLGVTLYQLATLALPFVAKHPDALRREILQGEPLRPRIRNKDLPRDLEVIIGCALDRSLRRRYAGADALAGDLRAFLAGRSPSKRPPSIALRAVRAVRRRPILAMASLALVTGPATYGVLQARHAGEVELLNERLTDALDGQRDATATAEANYALAIETVHQLLEQFSDQVLDHVPAVAPLRLDAIDRALAAYAALRGARGDDARLVFETALAYRARGDALYDLRRLDEALAAQLQHVSMLEGLRGAATTVPAPAGAPATGASSRDLDRELGIGRSRMGRTLMQLGRTVEAIAEHRQAIAAAQRALARTPGEPELGLALAAYRTNLGLSLADVAEVDAARAEFDEVIDAATALASELPADARPLVILARALRQRHSPPLVDPGDTARFVPLQRARAALVAALELQPRDRDLRDDLNQVDFLAASACVAQGDLERAQELLAACRASSEALALEFPDFADFTDKLLDVCGLSAHVAQLRGDSVAACSALRDAAEWTDRHAALHPEDLAIMNSARTRHINLANVYATSPALGEGRFESALLSLDAARKWHERLRAERAYPVDSAMAAFHLSYNSAVVLANLGRTEEAEGQMRELAAQAPTDAWSRRLVADGWCEIGNAMARDATPDAATESDRSRAASEALRWLEAAVEAGYDDRRELDSTPALSFLRQEPRFTALLAALGE